MKKLLLISLLISILMVGGGYYYFYILNPLQEEPQFPVKQRILIQKPVTSIQTKTVAKLDSKTEQQKEVKKEETKKAIETKKEDKKAQEVAKEKVEKKETKVAKKDEVKKEVASRVKDKKIEKKPKGYSIVYVVSNTDEAVKVKEELIGKGYHTSKVGKHGNKDAIIISPFTDKWEAEYVLKNIIKDTNIKGFRVVALY